MGALIWQLCPGSPHEGRYFGIAWLQHRVAVISLHYQIVIVMRLRSPNPVS